MFSDLYTIDSVSHQDGTSTWRVSLNPRSVIYSVHFPGNPITPGACQLEMMRSLASARIGRDMTMAKLRNIKYLQLIDPRTTSSFDVRMTFSQEEGETLTRCSAVISDGDRTFTKASLILK